MNKLSLALSSILMLAMVIIIIPSVIALNRGRMMRNIAIWLAIFTGLGLAYQLVGPGSTHPLFNLPDSMVRDESGQLTIGRGGNKEDEKNDSGEGFTPPKD